MDAHPPFRYIWQGNRLHTPENKVRGREMFVRLCDWCKGCYSATRITLMVSHRGGRRAINFISQSIASPIEVVLLDDKYSYSNSQGPKWNGKKSWQLVDVSRSTHRGNRLVMNVEHFSWRMLVSWHSISRPKNWRVWILNVKIKMGAAGKCLSKDNRGLSYP